MNRTFHVVLVKNQHIPYVVVHDPENDGRELMDAMKDAMGKGEFTVLGSYQDNERDLAQSHAYMALTAIQAVRKAEIKVSLNIPHEVSDNEIAMIKEEVDAIISPIRPDEIEARLALILQATAEIKNEDS